MSIILKLSDLLVGHDPLLVRHDPLQVLLGPFVNVQDREREKPILEIFSYLPISGWRNCCLVSKSWKNRLFSDRHHPLLVAIRTNQVESVKTLLQKGASAKLCMDRSHLTEVVNCTPYIYAEECGYHEIAALLEKPDGNFSKHYIKNKLLALLFELRAFNLEDCDFSDGLGHFVHHQYLVKWMTDSLKQFLAQYKSENWNPEKTEKLVSLLETSSCSSCHPEQPYDKECFFLSDTSIFNHRHWINIVRMDSWVVVGNRGLGCDVPGARFFKVKEFAFDSISAIATYYAKRATTLHEFDLQLSEQRSGSCAMMSFASGVMGALFLMIIEDSTDYVKVKEEVYSIFYAWRKESQISLLKQIITEDGEGYHPSILIKALICFDACEQTAQYFLDFLLSKGIIPWKDGESLDYAFTRDNDVFLHLVAKNIKGKKAHSFLRRCLTWEKYSAAEILCKNGVPLNAEGDCPSLFWEELRKANARGSTYDMTKLRWLLEHGANPNELDDQILIGIHPLKWSSEPEVVSLLMQYGSNIDASPTCPPCPIL
jgi:hypothetical protein